MKVYEGGRQLEGAMVTVNGRPLDPRFDLKTFSLAGFEWTYEGNGPRQLALAILSDYFGDECRALADCEQFMLDIVANLDNTWRLTSTEIAQWTRPKI